jgi:hypothetical protein
VTIDPPQSALDPSVESFSNGETADPAPTSIAPVPAVTTPAPEAPTAVQRTSNFDVHRNVAAETAPIRSSATGPQAGSWSWTAGAGGHAFLGIVPDWIVGGGPFVDLSRRTPALWNPSFRGSFLAATVDTTFSNGVGARLMWFIVRLEACPLHVLASDDLGLWLCLGLDSGAVQIRGKGLDNPNAETRAWFAPAALTRMEWTLTSQLTAELGAGLLVPARRYPIHYVPSDNTQAVDAYQVPVVAASTTIGVGYRFR